MGLGAGGDVDHHLQRLLGLSRGLGSSNMIAPADTLAALAAVTVSSAKTSTLACDVADGWR